MDLTLVRAVYERPSRTVEPVHRNEPAAIGSVVAPIARSSSRRIVWCGCTSSFSTCACHDTSDLPLGMRREHDKDWCREAFDRNAR